MKLLFDINHPAHVHLFKHVIWELEKRGHKIVITARDKDITTQLLDSYGFEYQVTSKQSTGLFNMLMELVRMVWVVFRQAKKHNLDFLIGTSVAAAYVSKITRAKSMVFGEDDKEVYPLFPAITFPFADYVVTPEILPDDYGEKHKKYAGNQELAYLHPNQFIPDPSVLDELGIDSDEIFSVLRFVSLQASHDVGQRGLSFEVKQILLQKLSAIGRVIISSEQELPQDFEKYRMPISPDKMHDVLYYASIFVGDSQSMTAEAAMLGTPAIRCNTFVGRISCLEQLEHEFGLTFGFLPEQEKAMLATVDKILAMPDLKEEFQKRRNKMLEEMIDVTQWIVEFIENSGNALGEKNV